MTTQRDDLSTTQHTREQALVRALGRALRVVEQTDLDEAVRISDELAEALHPLPGDDLDLSLDCCRVVEFIRPIPEPLDDLEEHLVDLFCRMEHETSVARIRAAAVVEVVRLHLEGGAA